MYLMWLWCYSTICIWCGNMMSLRCIYLMLWWCCSGVLEMLTMVQYCMLSMWLYDFTVLSYLMWLWCHSVVCICCGYDVVALYLFDVVMGCHSAACIWCGYTKSQCCMYLRSRWYRSTVGILCGYDVTIMYAFGVVMML